MAKCRECGAKYKDWNGTSVKLIVRKILGALYDNEAVGRKEAVLLALHLLQDEPTRNINYLSMLCDIGSVTEAELEDGFQKLVETGVLKKDTERTFQVSEKFKETLKNMIV